MKNLWYLVAAYTSVWIGFFLYAFSLHSRQNRLMEEIQGLKKRVENKLNQSPVLGRQSQVKE